MNGIQKIIFVPISREELEALIKECLKSEIQKAVTPPKEEDTLITRKEAAKLLNVSTTTLSGYCKSGVLVSYRIGSLIRFKKSQVISSLQEVRSLKYRRNN